MRRSGGGHPPLRPLALLWGGGIPRSKEHVVRTRRRRRRGTAAAGGAAACSASWPHCEAAQGRGSGGGKEGSALALPQTRARTTELAQTQQASSVSNAHKRTRLRPSGNDHDHHRSGSSPFFTVFLSPPSRNRSRGMPLLHRKPFVREKPPADLRPDEHVFHCRVTNEIFRDYE